jgi:hypothetical protein
MQGLRRAGRWKGLHGGTLRAYVGVSDAFRLELRGGDHSSARLRARGGVSRWTGIAAPGDRCGGDAGKLPGRVHHLRGRTWGRAQTRRAAAPPRPEGDRDDDQVRRPGAAAFVGAAAWRRDRRRGRCRGYTIRRIFVVDGDGQTGALHRRRVRRSRADGRVAATAPAPQESVHVQERGGRLGRVSDAAALSQPSVRRC